MTLGLKTLEQLVLESNDKHLLKMLASTPEVQDRMGAPKQPWTEIERHFANVFQETELFKLMPKRTPKAIKVQLSAMRCSGKVAQSIEQEKLIKQLNEQYVATKTEYESNEKKIAQLKVANHLLHVKLENLKRQLGTDIFG